MSQSSITCPRAASPTSSRSRGDNVPRIAATKAYVDQFGVDIYLPIIFVTIHFPGGTRSVPLPAIVDSGADRTVIPAALLVGSGIDFAALPSPSQSQGAGGGFETRPVDGKVRYRGWDVCEHFLVAEPGKLNYALLGRHDFFERFSVNFSWHRSPPEFFIDYQP
jgi:hypothetical protein